MTPRSRQTGLSLVELMVSITLGLMILSGVLVVFVNTSAARNEVERTSRQIENGRYASELLSEDIRLAGFYGELGVAALAAPGALPADPCSTNAADWNSWIPVYMQGYDEGAGLAATTCVLGNLKPNTDVLVIRRARTCVAGVAGCDTAANGKPYVQVSLCGTEATTHVLGLQGTATFDKTQRNCTTVAGQREYFVRIYFVSTDNGAGQNVPTLKRLQLTGAGWETVPLVEGIEEFQLHYGLDTTGDGVPDQYVANPNNYPLAAPTPLANWMNVVTVQFHLLARNLETTPNYTDAKTYYLGKDAAGSDIRVTPGLGYRRHVYSSLVRVVNPAGRRDTP
ncbi:MAG: PilW family protein, partial [Steroidobacteraceae bacterium]